MPDDLDIYDTGDDSGEERIPEITPDTGEDFGGGGNNPPDEQDTYEVIEDLEPIDPMDGLPYQDWYYKAGGVIRIFKDLLIKNFNALENKINQILNFDAEKIILADTSDIEVPDVYIDDEGDDKRILNRKSFYNICDIINFPLDIWTNGNNKVTAVKIINNSYQQVIIEAEGDNGTATSTYPYIYLNTANYEIVRNTSYTEDPDLLLLAVLNDNRLHTGNSPKGYNVDFMKILSKQTGDLTTVGVGFGNGYHSGVYNDQVVMIQNGQSKSSGSGTLEFIPYFLTGRVTN